MDYSFWVPLVATVINLYLTHRQIRFMEAQPNAAPLPKLFSAVSLRRYWPIGTMIVLMLLCWVPYFLKPPSAHYFLNWGRNNGGAAIYSIFDTSSLSSLKDRRRLMTIVVMADPRVDVKNNTQIGKSRTYEVELPFLEIDAFPPPEFRQKELLGPQNIDIFLLDVPKDFQIEQIHVLADAERFGGRVLDHQGFGTVPVRLQNQQAAQ